jgi:spoIIIJ-associated protein
MDFVETEGDTIDAAIDNALKLLGVGRDKITVDIIAEGRKGILGFGSQKARVRAELRKSPLERIETKITAEPKPAAAEAPAIGVDHAALAAKGEAALREILHLMGIKATVTQTVSANGDETILEIRTEDSGLLIGRKGQTLEALQYLVTRIAGERLASEGPHIVIDVEKYRERRRRTLEDMALRLGEKAKRQRKAVTVDALSAADRRVIHAALQDDPWLSTKSLGQGSYRRLLIIPEGDRKKREGTEPVPKANAQAATTSVKAPAPAEAESEDDQ